MKQFEIKKIKIVWNVFIKAVVLTFFFVNVGIMVADGLPDRSALGTKFIQTVERYQAFGMLYQPWSMFAPNPMNTNAYVEADIKFTDGTTTVWKMPRPSIISGARKVLTADRYRIVGQETLLPNENELVWFDISKYVLREIATIESKGQGRVVAEITFSRFSNKVLLPDEAPFIPHGQMSTEFLKESVFVYKPTTEKVRYEAKNVVQ
ncbi:hypothetical protein AZI87_12885 [Bdellovibrio bacteriovorus]|uniref:Uncharacterized protein n=1 Tax=Bdellovibrio bacteriovorus TaxID=959 RepID=A0A161PC95_BDEBC|nr:hypothetical protein [Bdellovibrio bacteriovorus]KYG65426.1 hypothetical protein AZI87_12885 [Bdellovibrio bacteriovorus]